MAVNLFVILPSPSFLEALNFLVACHLAEHFREDSQAAPLWD